MEIWDEIFAGKMFITDIGESITTVIDGREVELGRYAVFSPNKGQPGHQAIETGTDIDKLIAKYNISPECVCVLSQTRTDTP